MQRSPSSQQNEKHTTFSFEAIGTSWNIEIHKTLSPEAEGVLLDAIKSRIRDFDMAYSRFKPDSLVSTMSKKPDTYILPRDADKMMVLYEDMYKITKGAFTPLIGNTLSDTGYDAIYSFRPKSPEAITPPPTWAEAIEFNHTTHEILIKKPSIILDFGGIGKGYLIDIVGELLIEYGVDSFLINAGGDILYKNACKVNLPYLRIGLEHPADKTKVIGVTEIYNQAICASAGNRRAWANYHHIINPHTLTSPTEILATWVIADETIIADTIATALFFKDPEIFLEAGFKFEYLIIFPDYTIKKSEGFKADMFTL